MTQGVLNHSWARLTDFSPQNDTSPKRIERKRIKDWRRGDAVIVDRTSRWGNPFKLVEHGGEYTREEAIRLFTSAIRYRHDQIRQQLKGKDLACTCALDELCHADVLLRIANS